MDVMTIDSLDSLGRDYKEILTAWNEAMQKGVVVKVLDMPDLDTTVPGVAETVSAMLAYSSDWQRRHQARGIAEARAAGKYKGRKPIEVDKAEFESVYGEVQRGERTNRYAMKKLGLKNNTYYRFVREYKERTGMWEEDVER